MGRGFRRGDTLEYVVEGDHATLEIFRSFFLFFLSLDASPQKEFADLRNASLFPAGDFFELSIGIESNKYCRSAYAPSVSGASAVPPGLALATTNP
jgi:hypothetical protein